MHRPASSLPCLLLLAGLAACGSKPAAEPGAANPADSRTTTDATANLPGTGGCAALSTQARTAIVDLAHSLQQCTTRTDCRRIDDPALECIPCLYLAGNDQFKAALVAAHVCAASTSASCPVLRVPCPSGPFAYDCVQGQCVPAEPNRDSADGGETALPACSWPAALDPAPGAPVGACKAARHFLECSAGAGVHIGCLSNDATTCPAGAPAGASICQDQCNPGEYAVSCGAIGPGSWPAPPAACRTLPPNPGGITFACCPCGS
jgi:hypothetical protein